MLLRSIKLKNLLSFKDATLEDVRPLNVLIGPNGSGKSNLLEAIGLLQAAPVDLNRAITEGGGVREWIWRGMSHAEAVLPAPIPRSPFASIVCTVTSEMQSSLLTYKLEFAEHSQGFFIQTESLKAASLSPQQHPKVFFERTAENVSFPPQSEPGRIAGQESVLRSYRSPIDPTPISSIGREFERLRVYHEFQTGPRSQARWGIAPGAVKEFLEDGGANLAAVLQEMQFNGSLDKVTEHMREFCERYRAVRVREVGGVFRAYIVEEGIPEPVPSIRLSDGTLKFLCLLTILLNEKVPPLVCIDEPELGLHPDAVRLIARAIVEASRRTQLIITTHSETLVDELSDQPEAVVVCEYDEGSGTRFERLSKERLEGWLDRYSLGEIWRKGEIGGNRW
jgi:predicted ATPase